MVIEKEKMSQMAEQITEEVCDVVGIDFIEVRHTEEYFTEEAQAIYNKVYDVLGKNTFEKRIDNILNQFDKTIEKLNN